MGRWWGKMGMVVKEQHTAWRMMLFSIFTGVVGTGTNTSSNIL